MDVFDQFAILDQARRNAAELGTVIKKYVPAACTAELMEALLLHMMHKEHNAGERLFRMFEAGLIEGLSELSASRVFSNVPTRVS